jgi:hypothetical protein
MKDKNWTAIVHNTDHTVEITYDPDDDQLFVDRHTDNGWEESTKIECRLTENNNRHIWVVSFNDISQILVELWKADGKLTIAYRAWSYDSWGVPVTCTEITGEGAA